MVHIIKVDEESVLYEVPKHTTSPVLAGEWLICLDDRIFILTPHIGKEEEEEEETSGQDHLQ